MKTLEILIPTYGRPNSAMEAIRSCLENSDSRLSVRCNSNGYEPSLEKFRNLESRLTYDCFAENRGANVNFAYLLQATNARFCMLLSDEDRVDPRVMTEFLDFLDACPDSINVVSCSIFDLKTNRYYSRPNRLSEVDLDLSAVVALPIIPTYLSGIVFSVIELAKLDFTKLFALSMGNAYVHLDISRCLLTTGYLRIFRPCFILKGEEIKEGGDGYSHRSSRKPEVIGNLDLNPLVYGAMARAQQFYFCENNISNLRGHIGWASYVLSKLNAFVFFAEAVSSSNIVTVAEHGLSIRAETKLAMNNAKNLNEFSRSGVAYLFDLFVNLPPLFRKIVLKILVWFVSALNKSMVVAVLCRSKRI
jgi:hypothetical protein